MSGRWMGPCQSYHPQLISLGGVAPGPCFPCRVVHRRKLRVSPRDVSSQCHRAQCHRAQWDSDGQVYYQHGSACQHKLLQAARYSVGHQLHTRPGSLGVHSPTALLRAAALYKGGLLLGGNLHARRLPPCSGVTIGHVVIVPAFWNRCQCSRHLHSYWWCPPF